MHSVTSGAVYSKFLQHCFSTGIRIDESFSVAYQEGGVWYDNDVWWRVFESSNKNADYNTMYAEITVINVRYQHHAPNVTKYIVSPNYRTSPQPAVIQLYKSNASCHGIRIGRDSNNTWYVDLLLFANDYLIFAQGEGFKRSTKQAKVDMGGFSYVSYISN